MAYIDVHYTAVFLSHEPLDSRVLACGLGLLHSATVNSYSQHRA